MRIPLFEKTSYSKGVVKKKFLGGLFKTRTTSDCKNYYFLGIKFFCCNHRSNSHSAIINAVRTETYSALNAALRELHIEQFKNHYMVVDQHQKVFRQFKDIHRGSIGCVLGCAPSLNYYKKMANCYHFGVNTSLNYIRPDYWFSIDAVNVKNLYRQLELADFPKFIGQALVLPKYHVYKREDTKEVTFIPDCVIESFPNSHKFYIDHPSMVISRDISLQPLPDLGSSIFSALSFAIYTGCKTIYIIGCDCSLNGYFDGTKQRMEWYKGNIPELLIASWELYKEHISIFHPDVELISVNPVGLRGIFKEAYTKEYLNHHPEIKGVQIDLLEDLCNYKGSN